MKYEVHEAANMLPVMSDSEYQILKNDIEARGIQVPLIVSESGYIVDGRHRYKAALDIGLSDIPVVKCDDEEAWDVALSYNLVRRHLNESQRALIAARMAKSGSKSISECASTLNISAATARFAEKVLANCSKQVLDAVEAGSVRVSDAERIADRPRLEQNLILKRKQEARSSETLNGAARQFDREQQGNVPTPGLPDGKYEVIVADPPWMLAEVGRQDRLTKGSTSYAQMSDREIADLNVKNLAADNCWLFCWTIQTKLPATLEIIKEWEFDFRFCMVWRKLKKDLTGSKGPQMNNRPAYDCEFVVVAAKGNPLFADTKNFRTILDAPVRLHSEKPEEFYTLIERVCGTQKKRIDLFSRADKIGWDSWGKEDGKMG